MRISSSNLVSSSLMLQSLSCCPKEKKKRGDVTQQHSTICTIPRRRHQHQQPRLPICFLRLWDRNLSRIVVIIALFLLLLDGPKIRRLPSLVSASSSTTTTTTSLLSSSSQSSFSFDNIRSLDNYGNAPQLLYARNAANQHGRSIIIITNMPSLLSMTNSTSNGVTVEDTYSSVWILSPLRSHSQTRPFAVTSPFRRRRRGLRRKDDATNSNMNNISKNTTVPTTTQDSFSLLHPISSSTGTYLIATGIGGDIHYLLQQLRTFCKYNYERYDMGTTTTAATPQFTSILQLLLRQFWDYPNMKNNDDNDDDDDSEGGGGTWLPMGYQQMMQERSDERTSWGRPMGICGIILQWNAYQQQYIISDKFDPTGVVVQSQDEHNHNRRIVCLGPQHEALQEELLKIVTLRRRYLNKYTTLGVDNSTTTYNTSNNSTLLLLLQQEILTVIERVILYNNQTTINTNDDRQRRYYQLEIIHPPSLSSNQKVERSIQIISRTV